jgi:hypothetical protein
MCDIAGVGEREVTFADLGRDPEAVARGLLTWQRGDHDEAVGQTLAASARETHGKNMTLWIWTGQLPDRTPVWVLPVSVSHARAFAPQGPARVLVGTIGAAIDAGADPTGLCLHDWNGWVIIETPGADPDLVVLAISERVPDAGRIRLAPLPGTVTTAPELDLGRARGRTGLAAVGQAVGAHPVEVAIALAAHGQSLEIDANDPDMVRNVRNWGLSGDPLADEPDDDVIVGIDDDPCPRRRHARRVLQRLLRMGKVGANYHTAADHLYRGVPADQRHEAMDVGEALIRAGLLGEKPSVGQRHVYLRRDALPQIHALIERGESTAPALTELWTAPAPQRHPTPPNRAT